MGEQPTVLVVEDEPPLVDIFERWLEDSYEVRTATSGEAALESLDDGVDVVLLDRLMPGMSGDEVLDRVRDRNPDCQVAMVTAVEPDFEIIRMGFDDYLTKPVEREELLATVDGLLSRRAFDDLDREFYALASKRAALQTAKSAPELESSEEFAELEERMDDLRDDVDETTSGMEDGEFVAMVREIEAGGEMDEDGGGGGQ